jgi:hypothetical protein
VTGRIDSGPRLLLKARTVLSVTSVEGVGSDQRSDLGSQIRNQCAKLLDFLRGGDFHSFGGSTLVPSGRRVRSQLLPCEHRILPCVEACHRFDPENAI